MKNIDTCPYCGENCFEGEGCDEWQADGFNKEEPKQEYEYIGECKGNNGNGCFMDNPAHNCGCFVRKPKQETLEEAAEIDLTKLCYYDKRNPDFQIKEEYGYDKEEVEATGNFAKKDCACDNCFYGRSKLTEQLICQQEKRYSEEEMLQALNIGFTSTDETWEECVEFAKEQLKKK